MTYVGDGASICISTPPELCCLWGSRELGMRRHLQIITYLKNKWIQWFGNGKRTKNGGRGVILYVYHMNCYLSILFCAKLSQINVRLCTIALPLLDRGMNDERLHFACAADGEWTGVNHRYFLVRVNVHHLIWWYVYCELFCLWPTSNLMLCFGAMISYFHLLNIVPCESPLFSSPCQCTSFDLVVCVLWVILFVANVKLNVVLWCNDILLPFIKYCAPHILCYCFLSISKYAVICFKLIIIKQNLNFNIESLSCR